ncbi:putative transcriptional regulatory protein pb1a11.04c [Paramyrothecium foliicola]|nr:putative transcriptional regulatory protein pb1a11.04c [Paramyrothecium foliicola]
MSRKVGTTAVDGQTGFLIGELILKSKDFSSKVVAVVGLSLNPNSEHAQELKGPGATIVPHVPGRVKDKAKSLQQTGCDTICLVPHAHEGKFDICLELVEAAKEAQVPNVLLISSAGCDYADPQKQPRLRGFFGIKASPNVVSIGVARAKVVYLITHGDVPVGVLASTLASFGLQHGTFEIDNLPLYDKQAKEEGSLPIGENHKFAPVALRVSVSASEEQRSHEQNIVHLAAHVLTGKGKHGFDDRHRGQMMAMTGTLQAGRKNHVNARRLLTLADGRKREARRVPKSQSDIDPSEQQYLREDYSLVREGKTNNISTTAFYDVTGEHTTEPDQFFSIYNEEMRPKKAIKRKH